jgi:hypothetical protein
MLEKDFSDVLVSIVVFAVASTDFYKGVLLIFTNQTPLLFIAQIGFWLLRLMPESERIRQHQKAMAEYSNRRKINGLYAIVGGFFGIFLSILVFLYA